MKKSTLGALIGAGFAVWIVAMFVAAYIVLAPDASKGRVLGIAAMSLLFLIVMFSDRGYSLGQEEEEKKNNSL